MSAIQSVHVSDHSIPAGLPGQADLHTADSDAWSGFSTRINTSEVLTSAKGNISLISGYDDEYQIATACTLLIRASFISEKTTVLEFIPQRLLGETPVERRDIALSLARSVIQIVSADEFSEVRKSCPYLPEDGRERLGDVFKDHSSELDAEALVRMKADVQSIRIVSQGIALVPAEKVDTLAHEYGTRSFTALLIAQEIPFVLRDTGRHEAGDARFELLLPRHVFENEHCFKQQLLKICQKLLPDASTGTAGKQAAHPQREGLSREHTKPSPGKTRREPVSPKRPGGPAVPARSELVSGNVNPPPRKNWNVSPVLPARLKAPPAAPGANTQQIPAQQQTPPHTSEVRTQVYPESLPLPIPHSPEPDEAMRIARLVQELRSSNSIL